MDRHGYIRNRSEAPGELIFFQSLTLYLTLFELATSQPLCLDPDPHLTRIVNNVLRVSTPSMPLSLKRRSSAMEPEEDGPERAKRERLLGFMAPRDNRLHAPRYIIRFNLHIVSSEKIQSAIVSWMPSK
jgi:hypothetical protein